MAMRAAVGTTSCQPPMPGTKQSILVPMSTPPEHGAQRLDGPGAHSPPMRVPFWATERFISSTTGTSASVTTDNIKNTSK
jgi:hypothetical protein